MATAALVLSTVMISGCVSETVRESKPRKGPVAEVGWVDLGGGEVRYSVDGWGWVVRLRRRSAFHRMNRVCKGLKARMVDEYTHEDVDVPFSSDDLNQHLDHGVEHYKLATYHHMIFECYIPQQDVAKKGKGRP